MTEQKHTKGEWRYSINYGPDGEANYANVYDSDGALVGNFKLHHAMAIVSRGDPAAVMLEALREAEEYFYNLADADHDETGFVPNKEMELLTVVRAAIAKATRQ